LGDPAYISSPVSCLYLTLSLVSRASLYRSIYLYLSAILQQIHCIPLYPYVSSCIPVVSSRPRTTRRAPHIYPDISGDGLSAGRRVCWGGAGECSCGAPAAASRLPARVWRADARGLIIPRCHRMKASAGSTRPTQSPSQTPQGGNSTGGKQHRGETAHGETHPPTHPPPRVLQKRVAVQRLGGGG